MGGAKVTFSDDLSVNGIIHEIDRVLLPQEAPGGSSELGGAVSVPPTQTEVVSVPRGSKLRVCVRLCASAAEPECRGPAPRLRRLLQPPGGETGQLTGRSNQNATHADGSHVCSCRAPEWPSCWTGTPTRR